MSEQDMKAKTARQTEREQAQRFIDDHFIIVTVGAPTRKPDPEPGKGQAGT